MKLILTLILLVILLTACSLHNIKNSDSINCEEAALVACLAAERLGYTTRIEIQKTPQSNKGIYHAQCQVQINNEWKYITLDKWPTINIDSHREYQEGIEYWPIDKLYNICRQ
jgi:hypothetical protein